MEKLLKRLKGQKTNDPLEKSRKFFILECITGVGQFSLTSGAFLAGFIELLNGSNGLNGMIAVIPAVMGVLQVFSAIIYEKKDKRKPTIIMMASILRVMLSLVYFIPMLLLPYGFTLESVIVIYAIAYAMNALIAPPLSNWLVDLTPINRRGKYLAYREKISLIVTAILTIILGRVLDYSKLVGNQFLGFMVIGIVLIILGVLNVYALINIVELNQEHIKKEYKIKDVITIPLKNKGFRIIILLFILWNFGLQIGGPFIAIYMVSTLKLSFTYIMSLSVVMTIFRVICSKRWGNLADKKSWFLSTKLSVLILSITHFSWGFVTTNNYYVLIPILHILSGVAWGGIGISLFNIQFLFAEKEGRTMYLGLNAAIGGVFSLVAVSIGRRIIDYFENRTINIYSLNINNMQLVFFISGILLFLCSLFVYKFVEKQDIVNQE